MGGDPLLSKFRMGIFALSDFKQISCAVRRYRKEEAIISPAQTQGGLQMKGARAKTANEGTSY